MHHSLVRISEILSSEASPRAGGGHCYKAAATTEVISGANFSATTVTLNPFRSKQSDVVSPLTPAPITSTLPLEF